MLEHFSRKFRELTMSTEKLILQNSIDYYVNRKNDPITEVLATIPLMLQAVT